MIVAQPRSAVNDAPDFCSPYMLGVMDAEDGQLCCPEQYFTKQGQICEYAEGYEAVAGETLTTRQILGKPQMTDVQIAAEHADLIEGMSDEQFWSRGQW